MSQCRFHFDFDGSSESLVSKIRARVSGAGGRFDSFENGGSFSLPTPIGEFQGSFTVQEHTVWVDVDEKPAFVSCSTIESRLRDMVKAQR